MNELKWTNETPTTNGFYWHKEEKDSTPDVLGVEVVIESSGHRYTRCFYHNSYLDCEEELEGSFWAGPIPNPMS